MSNRAMTELESEMFKEIRVLKEELRWWREQDLIPRSTALALTVTYGVLNIKLLIEQLEQTPKAEPPNHIGESTEMVGDCETCKHYPYDEGYCGDCHAGVDKYEPYIPSKGVEYIYDQPDISKLKAGKISAKGIEFEEKKK